MSDNTYYVNRVCKRKTIAIKQTGKQIRHLPDLLS